MKVRSRVSRRKQAKENWKKSGKKTSFTEYWRNLLNESKM